MALTESTQAKHLVRIRSVLPENALIATRLDATEVMSQGFTLSVQAFSETHHNLSAADLVGTPVTVVLVQQDNSLRYFNGYVEKIAAAGSHRAGQRSGYSLTVVSWFQFLLAKSIDCRIFQDKTVVQILEEVFKPYGKLADFTLDIGGTRSEWRYCTQYAESDLNFVNRLCEREGLAYYFTHENGKHTLKIVSLDKAESLEANKPKKIQVQSGTAAFDHFTQWSSTEKFVTGKYTQKTYNYMKPTENLLVSETAGEAEKIKKVGDVEEYLYTDNYHTTKEGQANTENRAHHKGQHAVMQGGGNCRSLRVGHVIEVELPNNADFQHKGSEFALTKVVLTADDTVGGITCMVEAVPKGALVFPKGIKSVIQGLQTAVVTGPKGEEIHTDDLGRIKAQFHWDRIGKADENSSCWLRVMQGFAGNSFGAHFTPRIGHEVVVAFENGNPDRPFVLGALYHNEHRPPYADQQGSRAGIKTQSTKGGGETHYNELYFEDSKGKEEVYFQAEKDLNSVIKNDETRQVGNDQTLAVKNNRKNDIGNDHQESVKNNQEVSVGANQSIYVGKNQVTEVGGNSAHKIGKELVLEAGKKIVLKVGGSSIEITGSKIQIKSGKVDIDGGKILLN